MNPQTSKSMRSSERLLHRSYFRIVGNIKIKLGQIEVQLMTTISSLLCAQLWRLETSSRSVYNHNKMEIDSRWCLLFLMVSVHAFKRVKTTNSVWLVLIICVRLENQRGPEYRIQSSKSCKSFLALDHIYYLVKFHDQAIYNSKYILSKCT